jgi:tRNA(Ile)-lysidine synthase
MAQLGPWGTRQIAVAVSGGPDSLALAWLTHQWCRAQNRSLLVLCVDHALRPESAAEARYVTALMRSWAIPSQILTLHDLSSGPSIAARARAARYQAMIAACDQAGIIDLLLGHHARDQAETFLLRQEQHSGPAGLAAMAGVHVRDGVRLVRPLLGFSHQSLRDLLQQQNIRWIEDPSNQDASKSRVRLRMGLNDAAIAAARTAAARAAVTRTAQEIATARWLAEHVTIRPEGFAQIAAASCPPEALATLIQTIGGHEYPPPRAATAKLAAALRPATIMGVRLIKAPRSAPGFWLLREQAAMAPPVEAKPGALWDNRFRVTHCQHLPPGATIAATIGALGPDAAKFRDLSDLPAAVLQTFPVLRAGAMLLDIPFLPAPRHDSATPISLDFSPPRPATSALFRPNCH